MILLWLPIFVLKISKNLSLFFLFFPYLSFNFPQLIFIFISLYFNFLLLFLFFFSLYFSLPQTPTTLVDILIIYYLQHSILNIKKAPFTLINFWDPEVKNKFPIFSFIFLKFFDIIKRTLFVAFDDRYNILPVDLNILQA